MVRKGLSRGYIFIVTNRCMIGHFGISMLTHGSDKRERPKRNGVKGGRSPFILTLDGEGADTLSP